MRKSLGNFHVLQNLTNATELHLYSTSDATQDSRKTLESSSLITNSMTELCILFKVWYKSVNYKPEPTLRSAITSTGDTSLVASLRYRLMLVLLNPTFCS
jgi:hypothetical protein